MQTHTYQFRYDIATGDINNTSMSDVVLSAMFHKDVLIDSSEHKENHDSRKIYVDTSPKPLRKKSFANATRAVISSRMSIFGKVFVISKCVFQIPPTFTCTRCRPSH
jgi:hypothetical protein